MDKPLFLSNPDYRRAVLAFGLGLVTILTALGFEHIGGLEPCELCLAQRQPYYYGLPVLAAVLVLWKPLPAPPRLLLTLIVSGLFFWGTWLGAYHAGVEWGFWPGPTSCTGIGDALSFDALADIDAARVVPCDQVQWRLLGISMAGYNAIISLAIALLALRSTIGQFVTCQLDLQKMREKAEAKTKARS